MSSMWNGQIRPPTVYFDRFEVIKHLGDGAFGTVDLVHDLESPLPRFLAMKKISIKTVASRKSAEKEVFLMEAAHKYGSHKNIVRFEGHIDNSLFLTILTEYCDGGELSRQIVIGEGILSRTRAHVIFTQLLYAVDFLHNQGIAHRDIKADNIFLTEKGDVKLGDLGLGCVFRSRQGMQRFFNRCGTRSYMSPQVVEEDYRADAADIWSCGIVLVELLAGGLPWFYASESDPDFYSWMSNACDTTDHPWSKINENETNLIKRLLTVEEEQRPSTKEIFAYSFMRIMQPPPPLPKKPIFHV